MSLPVNLKTLGARILNHALVIADHAVRSEVECYAHGFNDEDGRPVYDTMRFQDGGAAEDLAVVERALKYIELRGDVWPWTLQRQKGAPHLVRFVEKEQQ